MSEEKFISEIKDFISEHPEDGDRILVEIDSLDMLNAFNEEISATGRTCKKIAINPHTGKIRCIEYE